jgi:peptidyl-tRNA hydrolase
MQQKLCSITNNFSEEQIIGIGRYGEVYKQGVHNGGEIAVKKLHSMQNDKQLSNEFRNLMKIEHLNIMRLIGYCYETCISR